MTTTTDTVTTPAALWAIVEIFGHQRIAGQVSEQEFGGCKMVRVDVPDVHYVERGGWNEARSDYEREIRTIAAHTRSFGPGAIYSVNWCDERTAKLAAASIRHRPVSPYELRNALEALPATERQQLLLGAEDRTATAEA